MKKFWRHQWWVITVLTTIPLVALAAQITFSPGSPIRSSDVNANFSELYTRTAGLPLRVQVATECDIAVDDSDCPCPPNTIVIGGGAAAGGSNALNASQALPADAPTFWRTACVSGGERVACVAPFAVCLFIQ